MVALLVAGAVVIVLAVAAGAYSVLSTRGPDHPDAWDPRVVDLVAFVEDVQGEPFEHPVHVDFLPAEEFDAGLEVDDAELTDEERDGLDRASGVLRALGGATGDVDLLEADNDMGTGGILAYYDPDDRRITVQGTEISTDVEVTLVHELTHAWQDQHDDIGRIGDLLTYEEDAAFRALVEGEATLVEQAFVAELGEADQQDYEATLDEQIEEFDEGTGQVPALLLAEEAAPYALGPAVLEVLLAVEGDDAIRDALADPPVSTEQLLDPRAYLGGDGPRDVEAPSTPGGGEPLEEDAFGALSLYLLLADRVDPVDALAVADAWDGDAYVVGRRDGRVCVAWAIAFEDGGPVDPADVVEEWADGLPDARVDADGDRVEVEACDPGPDEAVDVPGRSEAVLGYPVIRLYLWAGMAYEGLDADDAQDAERIDCFVDEVLRGIDPAEMDDGGPDEDRFDELTADARRACR